MKTLLTAIVFALVAITSANADAPCTVNSPDGELNVRDLTPNGPGKVMTLPGPLGVRSRTFSSPSGELTVQGASAFALVMATSANTIAVNRVFILALLSYWQDCQRD